MEKVMLRNLKELFFVRSRVLSGIHLFVGSISAPGLEKFRFTGNIGSGLKLEDVGSVTDAEVITKYYEVDGKQMEYDLELLSGLYGVESLKLDGNVFKEMMEGELAKCPTFLKLKKLTLGTSCMYCNFVLVSSFLKHCPNLEFLTLLHRHKYLEILIHDSYFFYHINGIP